jgi:hypothetical protein
MGMVTSAIWSDVNRDNKVDLVIVGEWMPITILIQDEYGNFVYKSDDFGFTNTHGWWNTISQADVDGDGDLDFLAGNAGLNSRFKPSTNEPIELWVGDLDMNGSTDPLITYYNDHNRYPFISKDQLIKQIPSLKKKFLRYNVFKNVSLEDLVTKENLAQFVHKKAEVFSSIWIENVGVKDYKIRPLPIEAQLFPIFSFALVDVNNDKHKDILAVGNWLEVQPELGQQDAGYGLIMLGGDNGQFRVQRNNGSGFWVPGAGRDIKLLNGSDKKEIIMVGRNNDSALTFMMLK